MQKVGQGTFGIIYMARSESNDRYAVKRVFENTKTINRELQLLKLLHPSEFLVKTYSYAYTKGDSQGNYLNIVMDFYPMNLVEFLVK